MIKPNILGGVFEYFFERLNNGDPVEEPFQFQVGRAGGWCVGLSTEGG